MKRFVGATGLGFWLWVSLARAQADGSFQLDYVAPPECPTASAFAAKIEGHTPLARLASTAEIARRFRAVFDTSGPAARGRLEIVDLDGTASLREVEGRDCSEVADALALIAAIVIDPNARPAPPQPADSGPATRPRPITEVTMPQPIPLPVRVPADRPTLEPDEEPLPLRLGLIFQAGAVGGQLMPRLGTALLFGVEALLDRPELFAPAARLSLYRTRSGEIVTPSGNARFEWTAARLSACPIHWSSGNLGLRPCLIADIGSITGEGYNTVDPQKQTLLWAALGAAGRAEAVFWGTLLLEIEAGALVPLSSQRFFFAPSEEVFQIGPGVYVLGGIGFRFL